jgi:hypothetical protein
VNWITVNWSNTLKEPGGVVHQKTKSINKESKPPKGMAKELKKGLVLVMLQVSIQKH